MKIKQINPNIWYLGVNDRKKELFENNWPLPYGVSYNSYLINDTKSALIDTVEFGSDRNYINEIKSVLNGRELDYLIINHMEPDHSGMIGWLLDIFPGLKIVGNNQTTKILNSYFKIPDENYIQVKDGEELRLGSSNLKFITAPWVHWPETMLTYETESQTLFSCDAFGGFGTLDGGIFNTEVDFEEHMSGEMRRYYSNIVAKYSNMVQKAFAKVSDIRIKMICPSHGLLWKEPEKVIGLYNAWSKYESKNEVVIAFASMYGNTEQIADYLGSLFAEAGMKVHTFDLSKTHVSYVLSEMWQCKVLLLGTCAYNTQMHPMMEHFCNEIKLAAPKEKVFGIFGSSSWNGAGVKSLKKFSEENGWNVVCPQVEVSGATSVEKMQESAKELVKAIIEQL